jgi:hypothetical protein|tara:strand:+ start:7770 stop:8222 length:453 start_codon:yes stop_codon:yes gene_type:complete
MAREPNVYDKFVRVNNNIPTQKNNQPEQALHSDEMPLSGMCDKIGDAFGPALDAIAEHQARQPAPLHKNEIYIPELPHALPFSRWASDNAFIRDVLVIDEKKRIKPRLSWYDPYDTTWVPTGWFAEGVMADMNYYFAEEKEVGGMKGMKM